MYKGNKFKNSMGAHLLQALFFETTIDFQNKADVLYTLKLEDHDVTDVTTGEAKRLPSLHRLYVELEDASEYEFAKKYFDGWSHWKKLCECNWFKPYLAEMREELDVKLKARALNTLRSVAEDKTNKSSYMANKFIIEQGLGVKKDNRGRPSKDKIRAEAEKLFVTKSEVDEDFERITLNG